MATKVTAQDLALEESIKAMMATQPAIEKGETIHIPSAEERKSKPATEMDTPVDSRDDAGRNVSSRQSALHRKECQDYRSQFLVHIPSRIRFQTYISKQIYDQLKLFLPVIAPETSITSFINNVLTHHLKQHQDDINELYAKNCAKSPVHYDRE